MKYVGTKEQLINTLREKADQLRKRANITQLQLSVKEVYGLHREAVGIELAIAMLEHWEQTFDTEVM